MHGDRFERRHRVDRAIGAEVANRLDRDRLRRASRRLGSGRISGRGSSGPLAVADVAAHRARHHGRSAPVPAPSPGVVVEAQHCIAHTDQGVVISLLRCRQRARGPCDGAVGPEAHRHGDRAAMPAEHEEGSDVRAPLVGVDLVLVLVAARVVAHLGEQLLGGLTGGRFIGNVRRRCRLDALGQRLVVARDHLDDGRLGAHCIVAPRFDRHHTDGLGGDRRIEARLDRHRARARVEPPAQHAVGAHRQRGGGVVGSADHPAATLVGRQLAHLTLHPQHRRDLGDAVDIRLHTHWQRPRRPGRPEVGGGTVEDVRDVLPRHHHPVGRRALGDVPAFSAPELDDGRRLRATGALVGIATGGEADEQGGGGESEAA